MSRIGPVDAFKTAVCVGSIYSKTLFSAVISELYACETVSLGTSNSSLAMGVFDESFVSEAGTAKTGRVNPVSSKPRIRNNDTARV